MPFGGYPANPVQESTEYFHGKKFGRFHEREVIGVVLPCNYFGAFQILSSLIDKERPGVIISTGLASSVQGIRIETRFHNNMNGKYPDNEGYHPVNIPIKLIASDFYDATADAAFLNQLLVSKNIPTEISNDADAFICNSLGFLTTKKILNERLRIKNTFIHIPWTDDYRDTVPLAPEKMYLEKEKLYQALELLFNAM